MIEQFVTQCFKRRGVMLLVFALLLVYGWYCWTKIPLEAYPDIAPVTSQVITQVNGLAAAEVEQQITIPLERALLATPGVTVIREARIVIADHGDSLALYIWIIFDNGSVPGRDR